MNIFHGEIYRIIDEYDRLVECLVYYNKNRVVCKLGFSNINVVPGDRVLIFTIGDIAFTDSIAIPYSSRKLQTLGVIRMFYDDSYIDIDVESIKIYKKMANIYTSLMSIKDDVILIAKQLDDLDSAADTYISIDNDQISITKKDSTILANENRIQIEAKKVSIPGLPEIDASRSTGGFSQIMYCPFTGLPHNTPNILGNPQQSQQSQQSQQQPPQQ